MLLIALFNKTCLIQMESYFADLALSEIVHFFEWFFKVAKNYIFWKINAE